MEPSAAAPELPDLLPSTVRRPMWQRALCVLGAVVCFVLGVVGWLIPFVTGIPFYAASLILLGMASGRVAGWVNRLDRRLPRGVRVQLRRWSGRAAKS